MAQVKEYYSSLTISDYKLGEFCMFIRNTTYDSKKITEKHMNYISKETVGGLAPDEEKGGLAPDVAGSTLVGGLAPDDGTNTIEKGGLAPDTGAAGASKGEFATFNKKKKVFGNHSYEVGRIIGINKEESKLYVQFEDTKEGFCHIFKAGISSDSFDMMDKLIQANGK